VRTVKFSFPSRLIFPSSLLGEQTRQSVRRFVFHSGLGGRTGLGYNSGK
jgi:hypothetical protein